MEEDKKENVEGTEELEEEGRETSDSEGVDKEKEKGVAPEDTPLPKTPFKLKSRDCAVCKLWFSSMVDLMHHVVEVHEVETGATSPVLFMMMEQLGIQQDILEATKLQMVRRTDSSNSIYLRP